MNTIDETTILPTKPITSYINHDKVCQKTWQPCCFICLSIETTYNLRVLLPCRHAVICSDCFKSLYKSAMFSVNHHLIGYITCPICRTPINSTLLLPRINYNDELDSEVTNVMNGDIITNNITEISM